MSSLCGLSLSKRRAFLARQLQVSLVLVHPPTHSFIQTMSKRHCLSLPIYKTGTVKVSYEIVGLTNAARQEQHLAKGNTNHTEWPLCGYHYD